MALSRPNLSFFTRSLRHFAKTEFQSGEYKCGTSQHPLDDVTRGEALIKCTYETIRNSPLWPGSVTAPGDQAQHSNYGFTFEQYGPRVPAVIVSPRIPQNIVDHSVYDHASIPAQSGLTDCSPVNCFEVPAPAAPTAVARPNVVHVAMQHDMEMSPERTRDIQNRVASLKTRGDAVQYLSEIRAKVQAKRR